MPHEGKSYTTELFQHQDTELLAAFKQKNIKTKGQKRKKFLVFLDALTHEQIPTNKERYVCVFALLLIVDTRSEEQQDSLCFASLALSQYSIQQSLSVTSKQRNIRAPSQRQ